MMRAIIYPSSFRAHTTQVYAGLAELAHAGLLGVHVAFGGRERVPAADNVVWVELEQPEQPSRARLCFDLSDGHLIRSIDGLEACTAYLKRSYSREYIASLDERNRSKIIPYGLNYSCISSREPQAMRRVLSHLLINRGRLASGDLHPLADGVKYLASRAGLHGRSTNLIPNFRSLERSADDPVERRALFVTRVFPVDGKDRRAAEDRLNLNASRVEIVRTLKRSLGRFFVGGIMDSLFARRYCPDCLAVFPTDRTSYLRQLDRSLIAVTSEGLHRSNGWKLPEYIAAAKCIVTEPLAYELPEPLVRGKNLLSFHTPAECVTACETLLDHPDLAQEMRHENERYYRAFLRPDRLVWSCLERALGLQERITAEPVLSRLPS